MIKCEKAAEHIKRQDTISNLAEEIHVSVHTIKYDIEELTLAYPIEIILGRKKVAFE